ncbi:MAG TPA: glycosyltransferase [Vicinamibacterales bacterium]
MSAPVVSVIVPAYNAEAWIARAVESALNQTFGDLEVIVCDDGSTDGTAGILRSYGDPRLRVLRRENRGRGAARNAAIAAARGRYLALLDADDWWLPDKLAGDLALLDASGGPALVYANLHVVDRDGQIARAMNNRHVVAHSGDVFPLLLQRNFVPTSTVVLPRETVEHAGPFDESLVRCQDWEWLLRVAARVPFRYRNEIVGFYDAHSWGTDEKTFATWEGALRVLELIERREPDRVAAARTELTRSRAAVHWELARAAEAKRDYARAVDHYRQALACTPEDERLSWALALACYRSGDREAAEAALSDHIARLPWAPVPRFYRGTLRLLAGDTAAARDDLRRALYVGPHDQHFPEAVNNLGVVHAREGDEEQAAVLFAQAVQQREGYSDALWNRLHVGSVPADALRVTPAKVF